jgi:hypothetical protein
MGIQIMTVDHGQIAATAALTVTSSRLSLIDRRIDTHRSELKASYSHRYRLTYQNGFHRQTQTRACGKPVDGMT